MSAAAAGARLLPPVVYVLLDHDVFVSVHQSWFAADVARRRVLDEANAQWQLTEGHPPPISAEDALRIEITEVDPGPDQAARNRLLDRTGRLRVADAELSFIHLSTRCLRPAGYCWIHDPSPGWINPLRDAAVHIRDETIYRACRHHDPYAHDDIGLHPDLDAWAFEAAMEPDPQAPPHPCCAWFCCLPEPPNEADRTAAAARVADLNDHHRAAGVEPLSEHEQRLVLHDTVLARLAQTPSSDRPPQEN